MMDGVGGERVVDDESVGKNERSRKMGLERNTGCTGDKWRRLTAGLGILGVF